MAQAAPRELELRLVNRDFGDICLSRVCGLILFQYAVKDLVDKTTLCIPPGRELEEFLVRLPGLMCGTAEKPIARPSYSPKFIDYVLAMCRNDEVIKNPRTDGRGLGGDTTWRVIAGDAAVRQGKNPVYQYKDENGKCSVEMKPDQAALDASAATSPHFLPPKWELRDACRGDIVYRSYPQVAYITAGPTSHSLKVTKGESEAPGPFLDALIIVTLQTVGIKRQKLLAPAGVDASVSPVDLLRQLFARLIDIEDYFRLVENGGADMLAHMIDAPAFNDAVFDEPFWDATWVVDTSTGSYTREEMVMIKETFLTKLKEIPPTDSSALSENEVDRQYIEMDDAIRFTTLIPDLAAVAHEVYGLHTPPLCDPKAIKCAWRDAIRRVEQAAQEDKE